ncbi:MAG: glycosyltransferase family 4 protein [Anaerolinea sp.]|nr:glycosyltransferase family 4 protein [Anaerolinea sp.]
MARILVHTLVFAPDGVSTSQIVSELAHDLHDYGHQVVVLTTQPHYNRDLDAEAQQPLQRRLFGMYYTSQYHGIRVIHTRMRRKADRVSGRFSDYLIFHALSLILAAFLIGRQDAVLSVSPPLTIGVIGWLLTLIKGGKAIYNVQEIYPAVMVQTGMLTEESRLYPILKRIERFVYRTSQVIVPISDGFKATIIAEGIAPGKVVTIPNFVDTEFICPQPKDNELSRELKLVDKYVVLYAGNIGITQSFDMIIEVMGRLADHPHIHFLIVGDGARRAQLEALIGEKRFPNVTMLPYQPRHVVPNIYATGDLHLVPLMAGTARTTIPSKIYTIMASGRPALVSVDHDSELVSVVQSANCGLATPPDNADALEAAILHAYAEREAFQQYGANGRRYIEQHYSRKAVSAQYDRLIRQLNNG